MTQQNNTRLGILLMIAVSAVFALQDGISRHLAGNYNVVMVVMIRYWFFALFVIALTMRRAGGLARVLRPAAPVTQVIRGLLLIVEINVMVTAFVLLGLVESHAVFAAYPLIVAALSGPLLGERIGWRRWTAIGAGFVGVLLILRPGAGVFSPWLLVPLLSATLFAVYNLLTRLVARWDGSATSFFWTGVVGAIAITPFGLWLWEPMSAPDWAWMAALCVSGALGHYLLIRCLEVAEASAVQPFAYFQMVFASALGVLVFGDALRLSTLSGAAVIVAAGLFTLWRERRVG